MSLAAEERATPLPRAWSARAKLGNGTAMLIALSAALLLVVLGSLAFGRYAIPLPQLFDLLWHGPAAATAAGGDAIAHTVFWNVRIPRVLAAVLVGAALAVPGAAYQGIFKNPMASSEMVGATSGAAFGVAIGIMMGLDIMAIQIMAFICGLLAVGITLGITALIGRGHDAVLVLVLVGIMVGAVFMAMVSAIKFVADPYSKLPAITFWLMGSLSVITPDDVWFVWRPLCVGLIPLLLLRWRLNLLALGDEEARALGIHTGRLRVVVILCATLMSASTVAIAGQVGGMGMGGVGLIIPHLARMVVGPNYRLLLPATALLGGIYLLLMDDLARSLSATELPLGILTSLVGAPFFVALLLRSRKGWA